MMRCPVCNYLFIDSVKTCAKCKVQLVPYGGPTQTTETGSLISNTQPSVQTNIQPNYNTQYPQNNTGQLIGYPPVYAYNPYGYIQQNPPTSGAAIASMILGIISLIGWIIPGAAWCAVLAIIFAIVGLGGNKGGKGMAVAGLVCGLIGAIPLFILIFAGAALASIF